MRSKTSSHREGEGWTVDSETGFAHRALGSDIRLTLPALPQNIAVVRHVVGCFAESLGMADDVVADLRLALTEACTNVVRHAYDQDSDGPLEITIHPTEETLNIMVADDGRGIGPSPDVAGPGLGLPLIAALTDGLEIQRRDGVGSRLLMSFRMRRVDGATA
jgi:anti-sigma regulatory factor (Ser/Thr protein kinase)